MHHAPGRTFEPIGSFTLFYEHGDEGDMEHGPTSELTVHFDKYSHVRITDDVMGHDPQDGEFMTLADALEEIRRNVMQMVTQRVTDAGGLPPAMP